MVDFSYNSNLIVQCSLPKGTTSPFHHVMQQSTSCNICSEKCCAGQTNMSRFCKGSVALFHHPVLSNPMRDAREYASTIQSAAESDLGFILLRNSPKTGWEEEEHCFILNRLLFLLRKTPPDKSGVASVVQCCQQSFLFHSI